jgi:hypothetical protein
MAWERALAAAVFAGKYQCLSLHIADVDGCRPSGSVGTTNADSHKIEHAIFAEIMKILSQIHHSRYVYFAMQT